MTTMKGENSFTILAGTGVYNIINNPAGSDKVLKIESLFLANSDGVNAANVNIRFYNADDLGGTGHFLAYLVSVPANSSLFALEDSSFYLKEDQSVGVNCTTSGDIHVLASWVDIS